MLGREPRVQSPVLDAYSDMPLYNTKAVVHQTGVPAPTLRAWERRYGILTPRRGDNDYRLYSERDMMLVAWLRERVESGMTISQAIALLHTLDSPRRRGSRRTRLVPATAEQAVSQPSLFAPQRIALGELGASLLSHCVRFDEPAAHRAISHAFAVYPVEEVCLGLFAPVLAEIGRLWSRGELSVTVEHFASALIRAQLESLLRSAGGAESGPLVLIGCAPGELHELGPMMLALFLRRAAVRVAYLGQNVEAESLLAAVSALRPACVILSAATRAPAEGLARLAGLLVPLLAVGARLCCGGQAFINEPELADRLGNVVQTDAREAVEQIKKWVAAA
jgi:methanogenic corrinoid protein MtbC1